MLNIWYSQDTMPSCFNNYIETPDLWFDSQSGEQYLAGDIERQMLKDIDNSIVLSNHAVENPIFGVIPPTDISGSIKTLILIKNDFEHIFNGSYMGELCAPWLQKLGESMDLTFRLGYLMRFSEPFCIRVVNSGAVVSTWKDLVSEAIPFLLLEDGQ